MIKWLIAWALLLSSTSLGAESVLDAMDFWLAYDIEPLQGWDQW